MERSRRLLAAILITGSLAPFSSTTATVLLDDGLTHLIDSAQNQSYLLRNGSELHVASGGSIIGDGSNANLGTYERAAIASSFGTVTLSGNARVIGGMGEYAIARSTDGDLRMEGDSYIRGSHPSGIALLGIDYSIAHTGLRTFLSDRAFIDGDVESDGYFYLADSAIINGDLLERNAGIALEMDGGLIRGHVRAGSFIDHTAIIRGGSILGGYGGTPFDLDFRMYGGRIAGGWNVNSFDLLTEIHGGRIDGGMTIGDFWARSNLSIFGGSIDAALNGWIFDFESGRYGDQGFSCSQSTSTFDIYGGQFGYASAGQGMRLGYCASLDIYGRDLTFAGGRLTGYLSDGNWLDVAVVTDDRWEGAVRLHNVPEPGTLGLLALGVFAVGCARRRGTKEARLDVAFRQQQLSFASRNKQKQMQRELFH